MTRQEVVDAMAERAEIPRAAAERALQAFTETIAGALRRGDRVSLVGFGTFEVSERKARKGRNPQTGAEIDIKATKAPRFKAGKALKDAVSASSGG